MKAMIALAGMFLCSIMFVKAQDTVRTLANPFFRDTGLVPPSLAYVEQMPRPKYDIGTFLSNNVIYPRKAQKARIEGKVIVSFVVDELGNITQLKILKSPNELLSEEALRVVSKMPPWEPGLMDGKPVKVLFRLPIEFSVE